MAWDWEMVGVGAEKTASSGVNSTLYGIRRGRATKLPLSSCAGSKSSPPSDNRFDARQSGYAVAQWKGDETYRGTCPGS